MIQQKGLKIKVENEMSDYLSCEVLFNKDCTKAWLGQPHLINDENNHSMIILKPTRIILLKHLAYQD
jgi:hypothetical protein